MPSSAAVPETCEHLVGRCIDAAEPEPLTPGKCQECDEHGESTVGAPADVPDLRPRRLL